MSTIENIKITYKTNPRSKSLSIKILNDNSVIVTRPVRVSLKHAEKFFEQNKALVFERINKNFIPLFEENVTYKSKYHEFKVTRSSSEKYSQRTLNRHLNIKIPAEINIGNNEAQEYIKQAIVKLLKTEAKQHLPKRIFELANLKGLKFNQVKINSAKTRWGSCNQKNDINLSCFLMLLPFHLIDYIILHELAHTVHKNHSSTFYHLLDKLVDGQHLLLNRELKKNRLGISPIYFQKSVN